MFEVFFVVQTNGDLLSCINNSPFEKTMELQDDGRVLIKGGEEHGWIEKEPDDLVYDENELAKIEEIVQDRPWVFWHLETSYPYLATLVTKAVLRSGLVLAADNDCGQIFDAAWFLQFVEACETWYLCGMNPGET